MLHDQTMQTCSRRRSQAPGSELVCLRQRENELLELETEEDERRNERCCWATEGLQPASSVRDMTWGSGGPHLGGPIAQYRRIVGFGVTDAP